MSGEPVPAGVVCSECGKEMWYNTHYTDATIVGEPYCLNCSVKSLETENSTSSDQEN